MIQFASSNSGTVAFPVFEVIEAFSKSSREPPMPMYGFGKIRSDQLIQTGEAFRLPRRTAPDGDRCDGNLTSARVPRAKAEGVIRRFGAAATGSSPFGEISAHFAIAAQSCGNKPGEICQAARWNGNFPATKRT